MHSRFPYLTTKAKTTIKIQNSLSIPNLSFSKMYTIPCAVDAPAYSCTVVFKILLCDFPLVFISVLAYIRRIIVTCY